MFKKILIANRGEIAVRVARACRELGIPSVAVYSDVDRAALHVRFADEAYPIGPAAAVESYLNIAKIIDVARRSGAEAIHPGYGFLSENPEFAEACARGGIKFIGPSASAMRAMGSKTRARQAAIAAKIPVVPGAANRLSREEAVKLAKEIGYPVMLKAAAGGGGKGMRLVRGAAELPSAYDAASSEAARAFGNGEVYLEKAIERPRHIEVQILADERGNCVYLGERECSLQRRHQKVLEEAPSAVVTPELRRGMGETAVRAAQAAGYTNAGTIEFLVDAEKSFYFLEMNTRLQVEHPVTELVTGLDLVQLQIRIASGEQLPFAQHDVALRGHAIECRIYAEDPENNFMPSPGKITRLVTPSGPGIREDSGVYEGWSVPIDYDPMLSKLIAWAPTRELAIRRLQRAFQEYFIGGIRSNLSLFRRILDDAAFQRAHFDTSTLDRMVAAAPSASASAPAPSQEAIFAALAAAVLASSNGTSISALRNGAPANAEKNSAWKQTARREALRD
jgi:acetyl-CoA carboxylase biotin carboxylase subunit